MREDETLDRNNQSVGGEENIGPVEYTIKAMFPFLDQNNEPVVDVQTALGRITCNLESLRPYMITDFMENHGDLPTESCIKKEIDKYHANAIYKGVHIPTYLRWASLGDTIIIHLNPNAGVNVRGQYLVIEPGSYRIVGETEVRFLHGKTAKELPTPRKLSRKEVMKILKRFVDICGLTREQVLLIITLLLDYFQSQTDHLILYIIGSEGSGKSTLQAFLRSLLDPSSSGLRALTKREEVINEAYNNAILCYDNISSSTINKRLEDLFCILSTGGSISYRRLFTSNKEVVMALKRPVIFSGIDDALTSPDVRERAVYILMKQRKDYRPKSEVQAELEALRPELFSAMINLYCQALKILPGIKLENASRMADFEKLGEAVCQALKLDMSFTQIRNKLDRQSTEESLDGVEECRTLIHYLERHKNGFTGNCGRLLKALQSTSEFPNQLPKSPKELKASLRRHEKSLSKVGITLSFSKTRTAKGYEVNVTKSPVKATS